MKFDIVTQILLILFAAMVTSGLGLIAWLIKRGLTKFDNHISKQDDHSQLLTTHGVVLDNTTKTVSDHSQILHDHGERITKIEGSP